MKRSWTLRPWKDRRVVFLSSNPTCHQCSDPSTTVQHLWHPGDVAIPSCRSDTNFEECLRHLKMSYELFEIGVVASCQHCAYMWDLEHKEMCPDCGAWRPRMAKHWQSKHGPLYHPLAYDPRTGKSNADIIEDVNKLLKEEFDTAYHSLCTSASEWEKMALDALGRLQSDVLFLAGKQ